jgi:hypothetical protein
MRRWLAVAFFAALVVGVSHPASADSITFTLDCTFTGATGCTPTAAPVGYITLTDNGNYVDFYVQLYDGAPINVVSVNYGASLTGTWTAFGGNIGTNQVNVSLDNANPFGRFDIQVDDYGTGSGGNGYADPLYFTLKQVNGGEVNLSVYDFLLKDDVNLLYGAAVGRYGSEAALVRYGATTVPDPASTLLLFSMGLTGLGAAWRKRRH